MVSIANADFSGTVCAHSLTGFFLKDVVKHGHKFYNQLDILVLS